VVIEEVGQAVAEIVIPQVFTQVLHIFNDNTTKNKVHAFIVVDMYYVHLQYE
jgi:microcompartment protein CcmL/EutN